MHVNHRTLLALALIGCTLASCTLPAAATPTALILPTSTLAPSPIPASPTAALASATALGFPTIATTQIVQPAPQSASGQVAPADYCADAQATALINSLKTALTTSNGTLLASLVSPTHGMEARLYRNGTVVTYDRQHAKFLFETTYSVDWGPAPGSGQETTGPFHETILPALLDVFNKDYTLSCNQVQVGGTTYDAKWPYSGINFYSVYYPGTAANGNMDWHTWLLGMHYVNGKPYLYSIVQFQWEP